MSRLDDIREVTKQYGGEETGGTDIDYLFSLIDRAAEMYQDQTDNSGYCPRCFAHPENHDPDCKLDHWLKEVNG